MDELLHRSILGRTTPSEESTVTAWRRSSAENEALYQRLSRLLTEVRRLDEAIDVGPPPPVAGLMLRGDRLASQKVEPSARARARRPLRYALRAVAIAAAAVLGFGVAQFRHAGTGSPFGGNEFVTGASDIATIRLTDGSVVRLAPRSLLRVSGGNRREAWLEGRAYFAVAKVEGRPFKVRTRAGDALVLGTRFDLATSDSGLQLVVAEGRVSLSADGKQIDVRAGEMGQVVEGSSLSVTTVPDVLPLMDWKGRFLAFQTTPLKDAAREIERQYGLRVVISDAALAEETISAWFVDKNHTELMKIVCMVVNASCSTEGNIVRMRR